MRWIVLGVLLLAAGPTAARAELFRLAQVVEARRAESAARASPVSGSAREAARVARLALIPCRTGFQLFRRETSILNAGSFAQRCTTYGGVINFN